MIALLFPRERLESSEKEARLASLQRSPGGHSHSHDSAIYSDLQQDTSSWETVDVNVDIFGVSGLDAGLDLAEEKPVLVSGIEKGAALEGKLRVNDAIVRVNDRDCRALERSEVLEQLRASAAGASTVSLVVKRKK